MAECDGRIKVTLVYVDDRNEEDLFIDVSRCKTLLDLVKEHGVVAFERDDGTLYEDMSTPLAIFADKRLRVRDWTRVTVRKHPRVYEQQRSAICERIIRALDNRDLTPEGRATLEEALEFFETQAAEVGATALAVHQHSTPQNERAFAAALGCN